MQGRQIMTLFALGTMEQSHPFDGTIREYQHGDRESLLNLIRELQAVECELYDRMKDPTTIDDEYLNDLQKECEKYCGHILVAEEKEGNSLLGYAVVLKRVPSETQQDGAYEVPYVFGTIAELSVTRDARRRGLGQILMQSCEKLVANAGVNYLRVSVLASNKKARRFYEKYGLRDHLVTMEKKVEKEVEE